MQKKIIKKIENWCFFEKYKLYLICDIKKKKINKKKLPVSIKSQFQKPPQNNSWSDHKDPKNIIIKILDVFFFKFIVLKKFKFKNIKKKVIAIGCTMDSLFVNFKN